MATDNYLRIGSAGGRLAVRPGRVHPLAPRRDQGALGPRRRRLAGIPRWPRPPGSGSRCRWWRCGDSTYGLRTA